MTDERPQTQLSFGSPVARAERGVWLEVDERSVGWIVFDLPGEKVNKLTTRVMETLRDLLDEAQRKNVCALVFASAKPNMFIAGADVDEIVTITDPKLGAQKAAYGQSVFEAVARFPRPTAVLITGPCVGGGYELALACTYRVAEDLPSVKVGLPEIKLGIVPGFGGTQRLPKRVGLRAALDLILAGKTLPAKPALRKGLIDALVPPGQGRRIVTEIVTGGREVMPGEPGKLDRVLGEIRFLRTFVLGRARGALTRKADRRHYPAPFRALECIGNAYGKGEVPAYRSEADALGECIVTPTSKNLTWLFQVSTRARTPIGVDPASARVAQRFAVVGAGIMGGGIAWLVGEKQKPVRVKDVAAESLSRALETAGTLWSKQVARRRLTARERDRRLEQLSFTLDTSGFQHVDLVFEAVVENLGIKRSVVAELEGVLPAHAVIASNTSSIPIDAIAAEAAHPERVVGIHFFNPVDKMPLVEIIAGSRSSSAAVATAFRAALDLGKTPILVKDGPGFLVNRLLAFYLGEALTLFEAGADIRRVDATLTDFGMPMGPFELLDQIGLDVAEKVTHVMGEAFGARLPAEHTLAGMVASGHLGKKSGRGFYHYKGGKPSDVAARASGNPTMSAEDLVDRLVLPMINEAARCLDEQVVARPLDVDLGMVFGTGFPPFRGGLLRYADQRGVGEIIERLEALSAATGERLQPSDALRARRAGFYDPSPAP